MTYITLSGLPPFNGRSDDDIMKAIKKGAFDFNQSVWKSTSSDAKDFITKLLTYDPAKRPTAAQALQHPWIVNNAKVQTDAKVTSVALDNLVSFHAHNTMKAATMTFIGSQLISKKEREELAAIFRLLDKNSDCKLSKKEVKDGYNDHYGKLISDDEIDKMFSAVDTDQSGFIDYTEFVVASMNEKALLTDSRLKGAFQMFDKDKSGMITPNEIREVLSAQENRIPQTVINAIIAQVDKNGDGEISLQEFQEMMKNASM
jgi:calcium-dependent protein kinase